MSLDIQVYCKEISKEMIPQMMERLNSYDMNVEVHPEFTFDIKDEGFVPFKFQLPDTPLRILSGKELISGFELYIGNFDLEIEKNKLKPKFSLANKLLGKKQKGIEFAEPHIEEVLKDCKKVISFVIHSGNSFEFRFATLVSAIVTELTNGVCLYTYENIWHNSQNISMSAYKEIKNYELTLTEETVEFAEFTGW